MRYFGRHTRETKYTITVITCSIAPILVFSRHIVVQELRQDSTGN